MAEFPAPADGCLAEAPQPIPQLRLRRAVSRHRDVGIPEIPGQQASDPFHIADELGPVQARVALIPGHRGRKQEPAPGRCFHQPPSPSAVQGPLPTPVQMARPVCTAVRYGPAL
jgi:hypothetical protein